MPPSHTCDETETDPGVRFCGIQHSPPRGSTNREVPVNRQEPYETRSMGDESMGQQAKDMADDARARAEGAADEVKNRTQQMATATQERADQGMDRAAEGMEQASARLRERADDSSTTGKAAGMAADGIDRGASYLRTHDTAQVWDDVEQYVGQHPAQALIGAVAAGFLIGRILR